ncbi:uncharacterized protein LOC110366601 [Fundulus heteroclitus]|uniref:uncharacterized protein LOC110366601 n=1 Tax=Fundulus heteroclitus TaxID=8078 RepID=UPI00165A9A51|nr:uncharacterized protein LOC110366601 [Fundulus heteroclitus]
MAAVSTCDSVLNKASMYICLYISPLASNGKRRCKNKEAHLQLVQQHRSCTIRTAVEEREDARVLPLWYLFVFFRPSSCSTVLLGATPPVFPWFLLSRPLLPGRKAPSDKSLDPPAVLDPWISLVLLGPPRSALQLPGHLLPCCLVIDPVPWAPVLAVSCPRRLALLPCIFLSQIKPLKRYPLSPSVFCMWARHLKANMTPGLLLCLVKFADDTTIEGLISNNDESHNKEVCRI